MRQAYIVSMDLPPHITAEEMRIMLDAAVKAMVIMEEGIQFDRRILRPRTITVKGKQHEPTDETRR